MSLSRSRAAWHPSEPSRGLPGEGSVDARRGPGTAAGHSRGRAARTRGGGGRECLAEMPITGEKSQVGYKAAADPLDSPPIASIDPTQERTGSETAFVPMLFVHLLTTDNFPQTEHCRVSYAVDNWLVKLVPPASHPSRTCLESLTILLSGHRQSRHVGRYGGAPTAAGLGEDCWAGRRS